MPWGDRFNGTEKVGPPTKRGGFGSAYNAVQQPAPAKKSGGHHGALGFVENLGTDVGSALLGIGPGLVHTVEHPIRTAKAIGQSYKQTYGPLTHGHLGKFLHNLYEHPLGPILDVATIATLGAGAGAKAGILSADAERLALRSPAVRAGQEGKVVEKLTSHNPVIRARQKLIHNALNRLPHDLPLLGETVRFGKEVDRLPRQEALRARQALRKYNRSIRGLSNEEIAATHLIGRGVHPQDYAAYLRKQPHVEPEMLKVLDNPKITEFVEHPSTAMERAIPAFRDLSVVDRELKVGRGLLTHETAAKRVTRLSREVYGSGSVPEGHVRLYRGEGKTGPIDANEIGDVAAGDKGNWFTDTKAVAEEYAKRNNGRLYYIDVLKEDAKPWSRLREDDYGRKWTEYRFPTKYGFRDSKQLYGEGIASGRKPSYEPFYVPDVPVAGRVSNAGFAKLGGGVGVPRLPGSLKVNKGVLARTGRLALHPDILGPEYLSTIKYGLFDDIHSELMSSAVRVKQGTPLPEGWAYLRKKVTNRFDENPRPQQIHPLIQKQGEVERSLHELAGPDAEALSQGKDTFASLRASDAETLHGDYLIVPKKLTDTVSGEFHRSNQAVRLFLDKPTKVWRALVLGFRVGFLTNNVVGNHLLYALHAAGIDGLRAYLNAVKREKGIGVVKSLLEDKQLPDPLRAKFMDEFFPEQVQGTFGKTQRPGASKLLSGKKGRKVRAATVGIAPATQALAEGTLRRGLVETFIRRSPEFKKVYRAMPSQTRDFEQAAAKVMRGEGGAEYQAAISRQVNHALGDYLGLSAVEQNTIRAIIPFYAWYKAITTITLHLAADTPGRADLLSKIGQLGSADTLKRLGSTKDYLEGLVPVGGQHGGKQEVLSTGGLNPFQTDQQLMQGVAGVLAGKPGATGRAFSQLGPNPFLLGAIENLAGKNLFTGRTLKSGHGLPGAILSEVAQQLPQAQLAKALAGHGRPSKLYGKQSAREAVLQFLGAPLKKIDVRQAGR